MPWDYDATRSVSMKDCATGRPVACQAEESGGKVRLTWLVLGLKAGGCRKLAVSCAARGKTAEAKPVVRVVDDSESGTVQVAVSGKPFTSYHYGNKCVRPFLHPVIGPGGAQVTRDWPVARGPKGEHRDHVHHKSIWVAHGECDAVDNWSEEAGHGWQRHRAFSALVSGRVFGEIASCNDWCDAGGKRQFEEYRRHRFYALGGGERLFDLEVTFRMTEGPVTFRDTKEGGLVSVRVASSMDVRNGGRIENGFGGVNEGETWGKKAPWCDYSGMVDGVRAGIALLDHDRNPRYPTEWHVRDYGLMTANCFAWQHYRPDSKERGDFAFEGNSVTTWRYRVYIHKGDADQGGVRSRFLDFIAPPVVAIR